MKADFIRKVLRFNLGCTFVEGLLVVSKYIQTPSESDAAVLLGFSFLRLSILLALALVLVLTVYLFISSKRPAWWEVMPGKFVVQVFERPEMFWLLTPVLALLYFLVFSTDAYLGFMAGYRGRLLPILIWFVFVASQWLLSWLYMQTLDFHFLENFRLVLIPAGIAFLLIFVVIGFISASHIGLTADAVYWQKAGVPILFAQLVLMIAMAGMLHLFFTKFNIPDHKKIDLLIFIVLWVVAFTIWMGQPARPSYNSLKPAPPNFQSYPFGDAMRYDLVAQEFLIGKPIPADFLAKPLYSFFLSVLHLIAGQNFDGIIMLQVAVLAFIPSLMYLLTRNLGGRLSGIIAAFLIIVRELNAIQLSNVIQVSHVKLLLSDALAMGNMMLLIWLMVQWLEKPSSRRALPIAVGGAMGLLIILRGHPVLIAPVLFLIVFIYLRKNGFLLRDGLWKITVGLLLVMLPWFWHTYDLTGRWAFQDDTSSLRLDAFAQSYAASTDTGSASYGQFEAQVFQHVLTHPVEVARFVSAHYFHNIVFSYVFLPQSLQIESLRSYVNRLPFWGTWHGELDIESRFLMLIHSSVLALGFGAAWKKTKGLTFIPVILGAAYNLSVAVTRRSGWRFIQPADWVTLVFYAIGIIQFILMLSSLVKRSVDIQADQRVDVDGSAISVPSRQSYASVSLPFFFIAIALVMGHKAFPTSYLAKNSNEVIRMYLDASQQSSGLDSVKIGQFMQHEGATIIYGKVLYPVYFKSKDGALNHLFPNFAPKPYGRIVFYVIGSEPAGVILPIDSRPSILPDGADVIVLGCKTKDGNIDALAVVLSGEVPATYQRDPMPELTCPLPEPE